MVDVSQNEAINGGSFSSFDKAAILSLISHELSNANQGVILMPYADYSALIQAETILPSSVPGIGTLGESDLPIYGSCAVPADTMFYLDPEQVELRASEMQIIKNSHAYARSGKTEITTSILGGGRVNPFAKVKAVKA